MVSNSLFLGKNQLWLDLVVTVLQPMGPNYKPICLERATVEAATQKVTFDDNCASIKRMKNGFVSPRFMIALEVS